MISDFHQRSYRLLIQGAFTVNSVDTFDLENYSVLQISGADRYEFLQGQFTQDVGVLTARSSALTGWTTAKGRLLAIGQLMEWNESIYLPLRADIAGQVAQRLQRFVLRANVMIELADITLLGLTTENSDPIRIGGLELPAKPGACSANEALYIARVTGDPKRAWVIGTSDATGAVSDSTNGAEGSANLWSLMNIRTGIPEIQAPTSEMFIPQMVNLDLLGGVSFTKGCYVGQEIVARTQNLGKIKRRMYRFQSESGSVFEPGQLIYGPGNATGKIVSSCLDEKSTEMLAVIAIDAAEEHWFTDEGRTLPIALQPLPYSIPKMS